MTALLALETSGALCSVAIWRGTERFEDTRNVERMHNQVLLEMIEGLTKQAQLRPADFQVVAFGAGPGSFTGVRIAAAVAQGIALVAGADVVPVSSSRARVSASQLRVNKLVAATRSRGDAYYLAGYQRREDHWQLILPDALHNRWPTSLLSGDWEYVGDQPEWPATEGSPLWRGGIAVRAPHIAELGWLAFGAGHGLDPADGLPLYVSGDRPWQPV